ncbi:unnamed protein product [Closterium sp. NIES-54]
MSLFKSKFLRILAQPVVPLFLLAPYQPFLVEAPCPVRTCWPAARAARSSSRRSPMRAAAERSSTRSFSTTVSSSSPTPLPAPSPSVALPRVHVQQEGA